MESLKKKKIQRNLQTRKGLTDLENELMVAGGRMRGEGIVREFGMVVYTLLCFTWITQKVLLYSTWDSAPCYVGSLDGREAWRRMDTCIYMAQSLPCSPETITTLLISCTPIQSKKFRKTKK